MNWIEYLQLNNEALGSIPIEVVEEFTEKLIQVRDIGGKVWVLGNGGSASTASHAVGDFGKTSKLNGARPLFSIAPSEMTALQTAYANDESFESAMSSTLRDFLAKDDAVWVISVSGRSPNLIAALDVAKEIGALTLATVGSRGAVMADSVDVGVCINSDDYQVVENAQLILMHWFTKSLQA